MGAHAAQFVRPPPSPTPPAPTPSPKRPSRLLHLSCSCCWQHIILFIFLLHLALCESATPEEREREREALLRFKSSLSNADPALADWNNPPRPPCPSLDGGEGGMTPGTSSWKGVLCYDGNVWGLQLEHMNMSGEIDVDSLLGLGQLRTLSFMYNKFEGPLPEFRKLGALKSLYLSHNKFSGSIPDDAFLGMLSLKKVYVANNNFQGNVPTSLASSPRLLELGIENNHFVGAIPNFPPSVIKFNASNNQLQGPIPASLQDIADPSSFSGNKDLCGAPLDTKCSEDGSSSQIPSNQTSAVPTPSPPVVPPEPETSNSTLRFIAFIISGLIAVATIVALYMVYHRSRCTHTETSRFGSSGTASSATYYKKRKDKDGFLLDGSTLPSNMTGSPAPTSVEGVNGAGVRAMPTAISQQYGAPDHQQLTRSHSRKSSGGSSDQHGKLSFVREDRTRFDLQDLLRASAEVLGSGSFGSSYKAVLMDGQAVVVKRFKQMNNCGREEFHEHMRRLGRLSHPNLLPLVAYYYRKEEKLLVFDFVHNGSLARQLHGNHTVDKPGLDWPTRLMIIKGVARGLAYLYAELPSLIVPHGHLKSSNVLLDKDMQPLLMDYTLVPVVNLEQGQNLMVAYKAPEYSKHGRTSKKSDVWSLGILILETLTGKFPANYLAQGPGYGPDLASWVDSIVGEAEANVDDVFDSEMGKKENAKGQMLKLLNIGVECCQVDVEKRLELKQAVDKIEQLDERDDIVQPSLAAS